MTVGVDADLRIREYPGDDSATARAVPFYFLDVDDLKVTRVNADSSETVLVRGTDYSVAGAGNPAGGSVTPLAPIATGTIWRIEGDMTLAQPTDYTAGDDFPAESHERGLDRAMIAAQELRRDAADTSARALMVPRGELAPTLPTAAARAGGFLAFDAEGRPVRAPGTGNDPDLRDQLAATGGDALVRTSRGALSQVVSRLPLFIEDYRGVGMSDLDTLDAAFAAWVAQGGGLLVAGAGRIYDLGTVSLGSTPILTVTGLRNAVLDWNGATVTIETTASVVAIGIEFADVQDLSIRNVSTTDAGFDIDQTWKGAFAFSFNGQSYPSDNISFENFRAESMLGPCLFYGDSHRLSGISFGSNCRFKNCYYGPSFQENGDNVSGGFATENVRRSYFAYGVSSHDLSISAYDDGAGPATECAFLIKRYQRDTTGIKLAIALSGSLDKYSELVNLEHQPTSGSGYIGEISLSLQLSRTIEDSAGIPRLVLRSYTGGVQDFGAITNEWGPISLDGNWGTVPGAHVIQYASPAVATPIAIMPGFSGFNQLKTFDVKNARVRYRADSDVFFKFGDLTAGNMAVALPATSGFISTFKVRIYAEAAPGAASGQKSCYREDIVALYNLGGGGGTAVEGFNNLANFAQNGAALTPTYTGGTNQLTIAFAGADYAVATAYARVEIEAISRVAKR
ncbi:MAG: hypothetical protein ACK4PC_00540 [Sphingopyxis sp.]